MKFYIGEGIKFINSHIIQDIHGFQIECKDLYGIVVGDLDPYYKIKLDWNTPLYTLAYGCDIVLQVQIQANTSKINPPLVIFHESINEVIKDFSNSVTTSKCDCGGFKTYGSMDDANHSSWCSSRQGKVS